MLTNPNTLGLFEEEIAEIAAAVHDVGGLLYYDGANLNAILGAVRPGDMGFDIVHMNLHKTFATPHGGGGPGAGPVAVRRATSSTSCPGPRATRVEDGRSTGSTPARSIGRVHGWHGNALVLARALAYIDVHGGDGLTRVAQHAVLNANWLRHRLRETLPAAYDRVCMHECVLSATPLKAAYGVRALDVAKAPPRRGLPRADGLLPADRRRGADVRADRDREPPDARGPRPGHRAHRRTRGVDPEALHHAPPHTPVSRVDEARAARHLIATADAELVLNRACGEVPPCYRQSHSRGES